MPKKRTKLEILEDAQAEKEPPRIQAAPVRQLRSNWPDRLVITAEQTPSGTRYDVTTSQVIDVDEADYEFLAGLTRKSNGCCGGVPNPPTIHLFSEVN